MSGKRIKNNDIKNILKDNNNNIDENNENEKQVYLFEPILKQNKENNLKHSTNKIIRRNNENNMIEHIKKRRINSGKLNYFTNKKEKVNGNNINNNLIMNNNNNDNHNNKIFKKQKNNFNFKKTNDNNDNNINIFNKNNKKKNDNLKIHQPFVTSVDFKNIQTNEEESKIISSKYKSKKNNLVCFGKSLNQILINNINEAIMKKGNIIKKKKKINFTPNNYNTNIKFKNFNNYEMHLKIFDDKLIEIYEDIQKKQKMYKKQRLNYLLPNLEEKKRKIISRIPLSIKGYKKNDIEIFYTRNICDLDYQKYYMKEKINMNDILENHNIYNRKDYLSAKVPFFMLTKSVVKPICKKSNSQQNFFSNGFKNISI